MSCKSKEHRQLSAAGNLTLLAVLIWAVILVASAPAVEAARADRHIMYGFEVPYPKKQSSELPTGQPPFLLDERLVPVTLRIDSRGKVAEVLADEPSDSLLVNYYRRNLESIRFEPGKVDGEESPMLLPLLLQFQPRRKLPDLFLPVDSNLIITDRDRYFKTLEMNDVTLPLLKSFPSYFCDLEWSDSLLILPYVLLSLQLDSVGTLVEIEVASTNYSAFALQLQSASLSAEFEPLYFKGLPRAASCFLLVSFFPQLSYPAESWEASSAGDYSILRRMQLRMLPDTVGLLTKPLPGFSPPDAVTIAGMHTGLADTVIATVTIDTLGMLSLYRFGKVTPQVRQGIQRLRKAVRFFPAMDYTGRPRDFYGTLRLIFSASAKIRIEYLW